LLHKIFNNFGEALNKLSSIIKEYRRKCNLDYQSARTIFEKVKNIRERNIFRDQIQIELDNIELHRVVFGLPITFTFSDKKSSSDDKQNDEIYTIQFIARKPSLIRFKIIQKKQQEKDEIQLLLIVFNPIKSGFKFPFIPTGKDIHKSWNQIRLNCKVKIEEVRTKNKDLKESKVKEKKQEFSVRIKNVNMRGFEIINRFIEDLVHSKQIQKVL
ncbi:MAG: hypothetical protein NZM44_02045, partial [Candidatus Calescibacterium sp.]|nr:hypothetical protein [Candidatus Calescibacterium sp.]